MFAFIKIIRIYEKILSKENWIFMQKYEKKLIILLLKFIREVEKIEITFRFVISWSIFVLLFRFQDEVIKFIRDIKFTGHLQNVKPIILIIKIKIYEEKYTQVINNSQESDPII